MVVPVIPKQREFRSNATKPFNDLLKYLEGVKDLEQAVRRELTDQFSDMLDYATNEVDETTKGDKCIAVRTHGVNSLDTAAIEMNAVSRRNTRCQDPVYHFILSWPEHERPEPAALFDAAVHSIKALGLGEHQYVIAVHDNTDNMHCHIAVNRVHPITFKSHNIEWAIKTLHYAAREIEIQHGWSHDNGLYIVQIDGQGRKKIVLNPDHAQSLAGAERHAHAGLERDALLPAWHDPESLESWLKKTVARALKEDLPELGSWHALHVWLGARGITLLDTGGGGLRLQATSSATGEILDLAASKGLRQLKRADLEKRWGAFADFNPIPIPVSNTDLSHLTLTQINEGVNHVLNNTLDRGVPPPDHVLRASDASEGSLAARPGSMYELPDGGMASEWAGASVLLPGALSDDLGDLEAGADQGLRRAGAAEGSSRGSGEQGLGASRKGERLGRDQAARELRKQQRAAARQDLRQRFSHYRRLVRAGDTDYFLQIKALRAERSAAIKEIKLQAKTAKSGVNVSTERADRLLTYIQIDAESNRQRAEIETAFQGKSADLRAQRNLPLSWRSWLTHQANLGDQAALSALRGIVYQAQRDAKRQSAGVADIEIATPEDRDNQFKAVMDCLLDEERHELAIRAASVRSMRPHEVDALLIRQAGIRWKVTGNGNIEFSDVDGGHLFTDRGNRLTFDRVFVTDEEIQLALLHAQSKFGQQLTLTGDDVDFARRMARIADDMGITVLNPELQEAIAQRRAQRATTALETIPSVTLQPAQPSTEILPEPQGQDLLRAKVLAIDPNAVFVEANMQAPGQYIGPVVSALENDVEPCFVQHTGRGVYVIHNFKAPAAQDDEILQIEYRDGEARTQLTRKGVGPEKS